jgi:ATP-dependent RNA helicase DeaD
VLSDALPPSEPRAPRERGEFGPSVWFKLSVGHTGRAEARWLLPKICEAGGISRDSIGAIRVQQDETFVQIANAVAGRFADSAELESGLTMDKLAGEPDLSRPERGERPERAPRAAAPRAAAPRPARADKPVYTPKPSRIVDEDSPAAPPRDEAPRKPYTPREDSERKPYAPRPAGERKPYAPREDGERKPYAPRPAGERKPYAPRADGERKPYAAREDAPRKPYAKREDGPSKPYAPREDGERKPRWAAGDKPAPKSAGFKSHGGSADRPARAEGYKSHRSEGGDRPRSDATGEKRPYAPRKDGADARPFVKKAGAGPAKAAGFKSHAAEGKKPFARTKPAAPKTDARDTSKRFVPPKKK